MKKKFYYWDRNTVYSTIEVIKYIFTLINRDANAELIFRTREIYLEAADLFKRTEQRVKHMTDSSRLPKQVYFALKTIHEIMDINSRHYER